jgi:hypothetical protein
MKLFTPVAILCDYTLVEHAVALRAMLESFRIHVDFYRFVQKPQVYSFFQGRQYPYTVIVCHGRGNTTEDMHLALEAVEQENSDYDQTDGWNAMTVKLTPAWISEYVRNRSGSLISTACGSGREPLAGAFLKAGYSSYTEPIGTYYNACAGQIFVSNFFYFLMSEDRDYVPTVFSERAAFNQAASIDPDFQYGPKVFRHYRAE